MLKIEKLQITGFKSFADSTEIVLGEGITAVVGPNGCGKSNIADAISWVLGEQSAKSLRGSKMEDVIFNGTRNRKPTGMAEVILTLCAVEDIRPVAETDDIQIPDEPDIEIDELEALAAPQPLHAVESEDSVAPADPSDGTADTAVDSTSRPAQKHVRRGPRSRNREMLLAAGERVTVGRRLYRSGESDYVMNGRSCRLRDVHDLFAGTGLGGYHYAIIEQGRIGQILSSKPQDRRALVEEAAGITKFKSRKRAAELRLDSSRQNLNRLNDIVSEIDRQIGSLKRQAAKARRHRRLRDEMRALLRDVYAADWERIEGELDRLDKLSKRARAEQDALTAELADRDAAHRVSAQAARDAEEELARVRDRAAAIELEADRARNLHRFQQEQLAALMIRREEIERDRVLIAERLDLLADERAQKEKELAELSAETDAEAAKVAAQEAAYQTQLRALEERERALEALRSKLVAEVGRSERLRHLRMQVDDAERRLGLDGARLDREAQTAATRRDEAATHLGELAEEMQMSQAKLDELRRTIVDRVEALAAARAAHHAATKALAKCQEERSARAHRLSSLEDLDARHAYYTDAVQQVLSLDNNTFNALGTLADYAEVEPEFEPALESLFGRELQSILVPGLDDALGGIEYLVTTTAGRAAFLVVGTGGAEADAEGSRGNRMGASVLDPGPHPALALLKLPAEIERAVARAYPDKAKALVVASLDEALERSREAEAAGDSRTFVTLRGEQVINGRVVVGGSAKAKGANLLGLKREIKEIKADLERIVWEVGSAEAGVTEAHRTVAELEAEAGRLDDTLRGDEKTAIERSMRQQQFESDFERAEQHIRVVESERKRLAEELEDLAARRDQLETDIAAALTDRGAVEAEIAEAQSALADIKVRVDVEGTALAEARTAAAARQERRRAAASELRRLGDEELDLNSRRDRSHVEGADVQSRIDQLSAALVETEGQTELFSAERAGMEDALATAIAALTAARQRVDSLEDEIAGLRERLDVARTRHSDFEVDRARLLSDSEHVRRGAVAELSQSIEEVVEAARSARDAGPAVTADVDDEQDEELDVDGEAGVDVYDIPLPADPAEAARARLEQIRRKLDQIGAVNMMALEELEEAEQRFQFLTTQRQDILDSIEATEDALSEIKKRSRVKFREAFAEINRNFGEMFQELFGGGRGEMVLLDEDDILESGIDIIAQPPGKRLQNVLLLSGGEKAMTAIALVLSIFKYKPSPFCILDEVDAPLDEVNVGRFSDHVIEMSQTTQFLVITHSKRTMEAARALYGVTMEEPGVSKLVSVKFADAEAQAAAI